MEKSEITKSEKYKVIDPMAFKKGIRKLGTVEKIAETLSVAEETVKKWLALENFPSSDMIEVLLEKYSLKIEDIGAIIDEECKDRNKIFAKILKQLIEEKKETRTEFVCEIGCGKSTLTEWLQGKYLPKPDILGKIAKHFNVTTSYLTGLTNIRTADNEAICSTLGADEDAISVWKQAKNISKLGKSTKKFIQEKFGFDYTDINNFIIKDKELKDIFYLEAYNVLSYYTDDIYKGKFEELHNELDVELDEEELGVDKKLIFGTTPIQTPYRKTVETIAKTVLQIKIGRMFDEFIENVMTEKNIKKFNNYELRMRRQELLEQNKKIKEEIDKIDEELKEKNNK